MHILVILWSWLEVAWGGGGRCLELLRIAYGAVPLGSTSRLPYSFSRSCPLRFASLRMSLLMLWMLRLRTIGAAVGGTQARVGCRGIEQDKGHLSDEAVITKWWALKSGRE